MMTFTQHGGGYDITFGLAETGIDTAWAVACGDKGEKAVKTAEKEITEVIFSTAERY